MDGVTDRPGSAGDVGPATSSEAGILRAADGGGVVDASGAAPLVIPGGDFLLDAEFVRELSLIHISEPTRPY